MKWYGSGSCSNRWYWFIYVDVDGVIFQFPDTCEYILEALYDFGSMLTGANTGLEFGRR